MKEERREQRSEKVEEVCDLCLNEQFYAFERRDDGFRDRAGRSAEQEVVHEVRGREDRLLRRCCCSCLCGRCCRWTRCSRCRRLFLCHVARVLLTDSTTDFTNSCVGDQFISSFDTHLRFPTATSAHRPKATHAIDIRRIKGNKFKYF